MKTVVCWKDRGALPRTLRHSKKAPITTMWKLVDTAKFKLNFVTNSSAWIVLPWTEFHMVMLTVVCNMLTLRFASTATTILAFLILVQSSIGIVRSMATRQNIHMLTVSIHMWKSLRGKIQTELFNEKFCLNNLPRIDFHIVLLTVVDYILRLCFTSPALRIVVY